MVLTTHLFLVPDCKWIGAISLPSFCACIGMSWDNRYLLPTYQTEWSQNSAHCKESSFTFCTCESICAFLWINVACKQAGIKLNLSSLLVMCTSLHFTYTFVWDHAVAQAASCCLITGARVWCQVSPFVIYGEQSGAGTSFSLSTSAFPCHCFSTHAQYLYYIHLLLTLYNLSNWQCFSKTLLTDVWQVVVCTSCVL